MGGIAAVIGPGPGRVEGGTVIERMLGASPHRGTERQTALHGRSLLGVSYDPERGDASLVVSNGVAVAFTGVLDNADELAASLHHPPEGASPAALVAEGFRQFGESLPERMRGAYSVVISDQQRLVCFRDHLGFAPLFYHRNGQGCVLGSEAKQVVCGAGIPREPDLEVVEDIFYGTDEETTPCALRGVERVPLASTFTSDGSGLRSRRYWDPGRLLETARFSADELHERFDAAMTQAARRMVTGNDVVTLSGGIDSPAVAAYAAPVHVERSGRPLQAVSAVYPDHPTVDERPYTELVARHLGLPLHPVIPRAGALDGLQEWTRLVDSPVPAGSLAMYQETYQWARGLGARTVLSGEFAEHVFDSRQFLLAHLLVRGKLGALGRQLGQRRARGRSVALLGLQLVGSLVVPRRSARRARSVGVPPWVLDQRRVSSTMDALSVSGARRWRHYQVAPLFRSGPGFEAASVCEEVSGVRGRRPWADVDLWELFLSLPAEVKFPDTLSKSLVRGLLRGRVPDAILDRRDKTRFDDSVVDRIDYALLDRFLLEPNHRLGSVDYALLAERLVRRDFDMAEFLWAKDLANAHAFLATW